MKVILLQSIKNFGRMGEIKSVSDGYARNYLLPQKLAKLATAHSIKEAEALRSKSEQEEKVRASQAQAVADKLKDATVTFTKSASDSGTLFASITDEDIAQAISKQAGVQITADMVDLDDFQNHIKHIGAHQVPLHLSKEVTITISVNVTPETSA